MVYVPNGAPDGYSAKYVFNAPNVKKSNGLQTPQPVTHRYSVLCASVSTAPRLLVDNESRQRCIGRTTYNSLTHLIWRMRSGTIDLNETFQPTCIDSMRGIGTSPSAAGVLIPAYPHLDLGIWDPFSNGALHWHIQPLHTGAGVADTVSGIQRGFRGGI